MKFRRQILHHILFFSSNVSLGKPSEGVDVIIMQSEHVQPKPLPPSTEAPPTAARLTFP